MMLLRAPLLSTMTLVALLASVSAQDSIPCTGDCSGGNAVTVDEILLAGSIALGERPLAACPAADPSGDGRVTVDEILMAIDSALAGCPEPVGIVALTNRHSRMCLEVADASSLEGANVQQGTCGAGAHQSWSFVAAGDDHFIVNEKSGHCLEVAGASNLDRGNIRQGACQDVPHQRWQVLRLRGLYLLSSLASAKCIDIEGSSVAAGGNAIQYECRGTNNQLWILPEEAVRSGL